SALGQGTRGSSLAHRPLRGEGVGGGDRQRKPLILRGLWRCRCLAELDALLNAFPRKMLPRTARSRLCAAATSTSFLNNSKKGHSQEEHRFEARRDVTTQTIASNVGFASKIVRHRRSRRDTDAGGKRPRVNAEIWPRIIAKKDTARGITRCTCRRWC